MAAAAPLIMAGGSIIGGLLGKDSAKKASAAQERLGREALGLQREQFEQGREDLRPWREAGAASLADLMEGIDSGRLIDGPNPADFREDPGYQYRLGEALRAVEGSAAARGVLQSGGTMKGVARVASGLADQGYNDWWNRTRAVQGDEFNRRSAVAGTGQAAVTQGVQQGANFASGASATLGQIGAARASGYAGQNQAIQGTLGNLMSIVGGIKF